MHADVSDCLQELVRWKAGRAEAFTSMLVSSNAAAKLLLPKSCILWSLDWKLILAYAG